MNDIVMELERIKKANEFYISYIKEHGYVGSKDYIKGYVDAIIDQNKHLKDIVKYKKGYMDTPF